jgi:para-nitrobenzyl esterase
MELPFMFNNVELQPEMTGNTDEAHVLEDVLSSAWIQFIKTGDPNHARMPRWEPFTEANPVYMIFDNKCEMKTIDADTKALMEYGVPLF